MAITRALLVWAALYTAAASPIPWQSCGSPTDLAKIVNVTVNPFPPSALPLYCLPISVADAIVLQAAARTLRLAWICTLRNPLQHPLTKSTALTTAFVSVAHESVCNCLQAAVIVAVSRSLHRPQRHGMWS